MKAKQKTIKRTHTKLSISAKNNLSTDDYEKDFFKWTKIQADLLKKQDFKKLDIANLIEEVESLGRTEKRALQSYLEVLLMHMLKIVHQPSMRSKSWELSIKNSRNKFKGILEDNPSLKNKLDSYIKESYKSARLQAAIETGLDEDEFPQECPWSKKQLMEESFFGF